MLSFATLCTTYDISEIEFLKIDTEGHDVVILRSLAAAVEAGVIAWPNRIKAECYNALSSKDTQAAIESLLTTAGYTIERVKEDILATKG